jgi:hypothetical protein
VASGKACGLVSASDGSSHQPKPNQEEKERAYDQAEPKPAHRIAGAAILGQVFDHFGWTACVAGIGVSLAVAALLALFLETPLEPEAMKHGGHRP